MSNTMFTNFGRSVISDALSSDKKLTFSKIAFGDKGTTPNKSHDVNAIGLINERFRMNLDSVYYPPQSSDNNAIVKITATLTPEQADSMDPVSVREFGLIDSEGNFLVLGDTVTTLTKEGSNANGIAFEFYVTLPSPEKIVNVVLSNSDGGFSEPFRLKLTNIEENATKNKTDSFLLDRANHTGQQSIDTIENLSNLLSELNSKIDVNKSNFKGMFLSHSAFISDIDASATPIVNDNYYNVETSSLWYYNVDKEWVDGNKITNDRLTYAENELGTIVSDMDKINSFFTSSIPLGVIDSISGLPSEPNFNVDDSTYSNTYFYAYVLETKTTWVFKPILNGEVVEGGDWINLNGDYSSNPLLDRSKHFGKQDISTIDGLEDYLNNVVTSSNFKGLFSNHTDFIEVNRKYPDGEEPDPGNVTDSAIGDNYLNMATKSKWYYISNGVWLDLNSGLVTDVNTNKTAIANLEIRLIEITDKLTNGTSLGIFNTIADLPSTPNYIEDDDSYSDIVYYAIVKETKSIFFYVPSYTLDIVTGGSWVNMDSNMSVVLEKLNTIEEGAQVNPAIVDNLISTDTDKTLAANQGMVLKGYIDNLNTAIDDINELLTSDDTTLDELQEIVNYIKSNKTVLETLAINNIAGLETALNNLTNNKADKTTMTTELGKKVNDSDFINKANNAINNYLPVGAPGTIPFTKENNSNLYVMDTILKVGHFTNSAAQLDSAKSFVKSFEQVFNTWHRISHNTTETQPALPAEISSWVYDTTTKSIVQPLNTSSLTGFISDEEVDVYNHEVILKSNNSDDDYIGVIIAFAVDGNGREYTLSASVDCGGVGTRWEITYNMSRSDRAKIVDGASKPIGTPSGGWAAYPLGVRVRVERNGDIIKVWRSAWSTTSNALVPATLLELDLKSDTRLAKFRGKSRYGYSSYSQANSTYEIIEGVKTLESTIFDLTTGNLQEFKDGTWKVVQGEKIQKYISPGKFLYNKDLGKLFFYVGDNGTVPIVMPIELK